MVGAAQDEGVDVRRLEGSRYSWVTANNSSPVTPASTNSTNRGRARHELQMGGSSERIVVRL